MWDETTLNTIYETGFGGSDMGLKAKQIFQHRVAPILTDGDYGKYVVIDTETGEFEIDADSYQASRRAYDKRPGARTRYGARIGFRAASRNWPTFPTKIKATSWQVVAS